MEDRKHTIITLSLILFLVVFLIVARVLLKLSKAFYLICGIGVALIAAILVYMVIRFRFNRRRKQLESQIISDSQELRIEYSFLRKVAGVPTKFRYRELEEATDYFRALIGQGASASVFKGVLKDGTPVAVKRIEGEKHGEKEFRAEVAAIASVQHVHLVHLFGYCTKSNSPGPRFLVYEFVPNGSLASWIFPQSKKSRHKNCPGGCLAWDLRYRVAIDVAKALAYLHHDCRSRILHLDVKPENILLDEHYRAVVSDFGLSKLMNKDESKVITSVRGTRGYLAPEWLLEHGISEKSDIYSYGMVLLELIGGRRNISQIENGDSRSKRKWEYFPRIVSTKVREGKIMEVVDPRLMENGVVIDEREVRRLVDVAFWCTQEKARMRPTMTAVVEMLEGRAAVEEPPDTQMVVVDLLSIEEETMRSHERPKVAAALGERINDRDVASSSSSYSYTVSGLSPR